MAASTTIPAGHFQSPWAFRGRMRSQRSALVRRGVTRAVATAFEDVEALWCKVDWQKKTRTEADAVKEKAYRAAYDAPFHGVPSGPYMGGRVADMNAHIAKRHRAFLGRARRALCGHDVTPEEFADTISRLSSTLGLSVDRAVTCVFGEPTLLAADNGDIIKRMVELRDGHEGEDLTELVVNSGGKLLGNAAGVICVEDD